MVRALWRDVPLVKTECSRHVQDDHSESPREGGAVCTRECLHVRQFPALPLRQSFILYMYRGTDGQGTVMILSFLNDLPKCLCKQCRPRSGSALLAMHFVCIVWKDCSTVRYICSNIRVNTVKHLVSKT